VGASDKPGMWRPIGASTAAVTFCSCVCSPTSLWPLASADEEGRAGLVRCAHLRGQMGSC
jgi:hypothetical protein